MKKIMKVWTLILVCTLTLTSCGMTQQEGHAEKKVENIDGC